MYTNYWELEKKPFEIGADPYFYYPSESFQSVLLKLRYTLESRHGSAQLRGPAGVGKTMIATMLEAQLNPSANPGAWVTLRLPQLNADEILCYLAENLDPEAKLFPGMIGNSLNVAGCARSGKETSPFLHHVLCVVEKVLIRNAREKRSSLLVVENAQQIVDPRVYPLFKSLLGIEYAGRPALSILLVSTNNTYTEEPQPAFIENCMDAIAVLEPFTFAETSEYIIHRLKMAGGKNEIFTEDALETVYRLTGGVSRRINRLCDLALLVGFAERMEQLDGSVIETLNHELLAAS